MQHVFSPFAFMALLLLPAFPAQAESCVTNATQQDHFFAVTPKGGVRLTGWLGPAEQLCSPHQDGGILSVFESETVLEGCSRLVGPNQSDTLVAYAEFDRCHWASHDH
ncbi:hypothetical protein [Aliiroseovarius crassostreae]|uniref:hypothetical protein n=2 Tax=Aliiroseovarius crassostreae TaxID=154981 RepID=UPI0021FADF56|nr:hypothetical protein [Aliiroseovarius crassostreae]UWP90159.1 hypothetical protein K3J57_05675 [Aliiroseovarius crassostreae]